MFSCYGITANGNISPVGFAIVFGNENSTTWNKFWNFVKDIHPLLNLPDVPIVTDQDKGQKSAITTIMDGTGHFSLCTSPEGEYNQNVWIEEWDSRVLGAVGVQSFSGV